MPPGSRSSSVSMPRIRPPLLRSVHAPLFRTKTVSQMQPNRSSTAPEKRCLRRRLRQHAGRPSNNSVKPETASPISSRAAFRRAPTTGNPSPRADAAFQAVRPVCPGSLSRRMVHAAFQIAGAPIPSATACSSGLLAGLTSSMSCPAPC